MAQSFLHILPRSGDQTTVITALKKQYNWLRNPETLNGGEVKVKEMRDFIVFAQKKPLDNVGINLVITNAELISSEVANTMLKILEEPPPYLTFHLITHNPHRVLPTILSRCHRVHHQVEKAGDASSISHNKLFDELLNIKQVAKDDGLENYLLEKERRAIADGQWDAARQLDKVLNQFGTTNVNVSLQLESIAIAHIDTHQK